MGFSKSKGMRKKIMLVFGTRPEAIKMAPLIKEFQKYPDKFHVLVCVTGQHRQMLDQVLRLFEIKPDYDLNVMKSNQDLYDITSSILTGMRDVLRQAQPDWVMVHGDTTTSTVAALAAFYQKIPVAHVEAGLRTHNMFSPWPEEINRQITSRIAAYNFAPTPLSKQNLLEERIRESSISVTGNTVIDALYWVTQKIKTDKKLQEEINETLIRSGLPEKVAHSSTPQLVLITGHRRENFGEGFTHICRAIKTLSEKYPEIHFIYPMHLNPNVRGPIHEVFNDGKRENLHFIEPLDYLPFVCLMEKSRLILTDSGGIQEEAPSLGKPVLVMRDTTERPEALEAGTVRLVGTDYDRIVSEASRLLSDDNHYYSRSTRTNPYGDGRACERIVEKMSEII